MTLDFNVIENRLLIAYMMKHVAAYYKVNKHGDAMSQMFSKFLEQEAAEIETETLKRVKDGTNT